MPCAQQDGSIDIRVENDTTRSLPSFIESSGTGIVLSDNENFLKTPLQHWILFITFYNLNLHNELPTSVYILFC